MKDKRIYSENPDRRKNIIIIASVIAVIVIVILLLLKSCGGGPAASYRYTADENSSYGEIAGKSREEIVEELNNQVEKGMMNISMNLYPTFENGQSEGNLLIYNSENNRFPQIVSIYRKDTGELIYESGGIDVGYRLESARLSVCLEKGEYPCTAYFCAVDRQTGQCLGKAGADIVITVLN